MNLKNKSAIVQCPQCSSNINKFNQKKRGFLFLFVLTPLLSILVYIFLDIYAMVISLLVSLVIDISLILAKKRYHYICKNCSWELKVEKEIKNE
ncbi:MAG: hypothetical protein ACNI25_03910 [Halarcobacter sp.]